MVKKLAAAAVAGLLVALSFGSVAGAEEVDCITDDEALDVLEEYSDYVPVPFLSPEGFLTLLKNNSHWFEDVNLNELGDSLNNLQQEFGVEADPEARKAVEESLAQFFDSEGNFRGFCEDETGGPPACVDINTADVGELTLLKHVDEKRAGEIVDLRPFDSVEDISRVDGFNGDGINLAEMVEGDDDHLPLCDNFEAGGPSPDPKSDETLPVTGLNMWQLLIIGGVIIAGGAAMLLVKKRQAISLN